MARRSNVARRMSSDVAIEPEVEAEIKTEMIAQIEAVVAIATEAAAQTELAIQTPPSFDLIKEVDILKAGEQWLVAHFGNKSKAIRGLSALGHKCGPISRALDIRYQHARNVLSRPLKRLIKEERDAAKNGVDYVPETDE